MVGTRSAIPPKRSTRNTSSAVDPSPPCLNAPAQPSFSNSVEPDAPATVALTVKGMWSRAPSIGQIEAAFTQEGRAQHPISQIKVAVDHAVVHVHPDDVPGCVGIIGSGDLQLTVSVCYPDSIAQAPPPSVAPPSVGGARGSPAPILASPVAAAVAPPKAKRAKVEHVQSMPPPSMPPPMPPALGEPLPDSLLGSGLLGSMGEPSSEMAEIMGAAAEQEGFIMNGVVRPMTVLTAEQQAVQAAAQQAAQAKADAKREEEKQRRLYRVGLSYRCGRCGKPKKGHVCDVPEDGEAPIQQNTDMPQVSPTPAILATTVRKGTPPALLGSPLHAGSPHLRNTLGSPLAHGAVPAQPSPMSMSDVKVTGEATTIFKDMVAALGENGSSSGLSPNGASLSPNGAPPPQIASSISSISPLAASAIAAGSVSNAASAGAVPTVGGGAAEPQLSEMDLMLADLAFAARPPPVITPDEGGTNDVANGLGSLSPSNFSPGTMIQQLITTPGHTGWSASQLAEVGGLTTAQPIVASALRASVIAQPSA